METEAGDDQVRITLIGGPRDGQELLLGRPLPTCIAAQATTDERSLIYYYTPSADDPTRWHVVDGVRRNGTG